MSCTPGTATANEDLSLNEEYNTIMDGQKKSSDHLSPAAVLACTLQHHHQHFLSPRRLLTRMARIWRFMVAESVYCFLFSLSTRSCYHQRNDAVSNLLQVSTTAETQHNKEKKRILWAFKGTIRVRIIDGETNERSQSAGYSMRRFCLFWGNSWIGFDEGQGSDTDLLLRYDRTHYSRKVTETCCHYE